MRPAVSLGVRLTVAMVGLVVLTAAAVEFFAYRGVVAAIEPTELRRLDASVHRAADELTEIVEESRAELEGYRTAVPVEGLVRATNAGGVDPFTGMGAANWRQAIRRRMERELRLRPAYLSFRLLREAPGGPEVLRVERVRAGGEVRIVPDSALRPGGEDAAFRPRHTRDFRVEFAPAAEPGDRMLRLSTPLTDADGRHFGVLQLEQSFRGLLRGLPPTDDSTVARFVLDERGWSLVAPEYVPPEARALAAAPRLADALPPLEAALRGQPLAPQFTRTRTAGTQALAAVTVRLAGGPNVMLVQTVARDRLLAPTWPIRVASLLAALAAAAAATLLAFVLARRITGPIDRMARAVRSARVEHVAVTGQAETGIGELHGLASAIETMRADLERKAGDLAESEARLALALKTAGMGVWVLDVASGRLHWSEETQRIVGRPVANPTVAEFAAMLHPDDLELVRNAMDHALATRTEFRLEFRGYRADGRLIWLSDVGVAQYAADGTPIRMIGTVQDVTARREAEEALRTSEERFRMLAGAMDDVFWITEPECRRVLYVSPAYEGVWGRSASELLANPLAWLEAVHPDERLVVAETMQAGARRRSGWEYTYRVIRPDGGVRWIHDRGFPVLDDAGEVRLVVGVAKDVTRQRELEAQFRQAQKMESVGQLAGGVAHDFNNLLTVIQGHVALLREGIVEAEDDSLEQIALAAERAAALTRQLLAFSRRQALQRRVVDLGVVLRNLSRLLARLLGEDVKLALEPGTGVPAVLADVGMIEQVVMNLAVNSRDAMPRGGRLTLRTSYEAMDAAEAGRHAGAPASPLVCLTVEDDGTGMDAETLQHAFEPFFTTKDIGKGTGLGLATVYGIVQQHQGWISVDSAPARGTRFRIWLPAAHPPASATAQLSASTESPGGPETILLVEDEAAVRELLAGVLRRTGYRVLTAGTARAALEIWNEHRDVIQFLVTDMVMPDGMNGRELLDRLRAERPGLPTVCMSGYSASVIQSATGLGRGVVFLHKPFMPSDLLREIRQLLDGPRV